MREFNGSNETREDVAMKIKKEQEELCFRQLIEAAEALMRMDFHDQVNIYKKSWHSASSVELVIAKAKMDGALRKAKSIISI